jgi:sterol desaturase/sphingolipid hydroxylase (fatty acid hydroxylase superfamily)
MENYVHIFQNAFNGSLNWVLKSICFEVPWQHNYFWGLTIISFLIWLLELLFPWRKNQKSFRKDFWLDAFYMYFNFFVFTIVISGFYKILASLYNDFGLSIKSLVLFDISNVPVWLQLIIFFVLLDFVQWFTHLLLHRYAFLWNFHQVHHSVKEMGFAAHLRYHWMENILYKPLKTIAVMLLGGFEPEQAYIVHFVAIAIGHLNHSNIKISWGVFKYVLNSPVMHLYHHAKILPKHLNKGVNFGISLSVWDYIFKTNYIPESSGNVVLGWRGDEDFPKSFLKQLQVGFRKQEKETYRN